ncbi:hypothetical protein N7481_009724 [Penicillium waksmanii]|uniref:uncharacterized protein n=1 Tax=Penicillium waksmanii TaxID=69791 RepID=UPI0025496AF4|nr:uncharacterized protein N7481_009724 [Penicillium waksmanii]KAJ5976017.1 hypothetical protein N7481_009724 [Penicillium waksmanii]
MSQKSKTSITHNFEKYSTKEDVVAMPLENINTLEAAVNSEIVENPENARDSTNVIKSTTPGYSTIGQSVTAHIRGTRLRSGEH